MDTRLFRQTVGQFVTGVTVIVLEAGGAIRAMTANSFTSLSLDPPLVLFCVNKNTKLGQDVHTARGFSINILAGDQQDLSRYFAGTWRDPVPPAFNFVAWEGAPRLERCAASLGCAIEAIHSGGDHWIVVGRVLALHTSGTDTVPLVFFGGRYVSLAQAIG